MLKQKCVRPIGDERMYVRGATPVRLTWFGYKKIPIEYAIRKQQPASLVQIQSEILTISFTLITVAAPAQATQFIFTLQLRGPFGAGMRARFSAFLALCTAGSARTLPRHSLFIILAIIRG